MTGAWAPTGGRRQIAGLTRRQTRGGHMSDDEAQARLARMEVMVEEIWGILNRRQAQIATDFRRRKRSGEFDARGVEVIDNRKGERRRVQNEKE